MRVRGNIFWGSVLVLLAALLFLHQQEILPVDLWDVFWPAAIILVGIWLIVSVIAGPKVVAGEAVSIPLQGATGAHIKLEYGAGKLTLGSGTGPAEIINGVFTYGLESKSTLAGDKLVVEMKPTSRFWNWVPGTGLNWDVKVNQDIPLSLDIDAGASTSIIDLTDLKVSKTTIDTGASSTDIKLPADLNMTYLEISAGASTLNVHVPKGTAARIQIESGMATINVNADRFPKQERNLYESPDYATANKRADIRIDTGVSTVNVD